MTSTNNARSPGLKTYFKTPEGRYKLLYEKAHPSGLLHYAQGKGITQVTIAHLKERPAPQPTPSSSLAGGSGVRLAARLWGAGNGSRSFGLISGNGTNKTASGSNRIGSFVAHSGGSVIPPTNPSSTNFDGKGTYLISNVGDTLFMSDYNTHDKDPVKVIYFGTSNPVCHAFDPEAKDGHDLLIGLSSGDVYLVSLRQQLQDPGKRLVGAQHYNKDGVMNNSRCTSITWVPEADGLFVVAHADGNLFVYDKAKDYTADSSFPIIKDQTQFSVAHAKSNK